jgi:decaprenyl-phosphate phosphoribosyltransferase
VTTQIPARTAAHAADRAAARSHSLSRWLAAVVRTARPRQWPKNLLVFAAPLAGATLGRDNGLGYALVAAAAFWCASAAVYFINDVADADRDRRHPRKRYRPIAAGDLPKSHAIALAALCVAAAMTAGFAIGEPLLTAAAGGYLGLSFLYSLGLKHIPVIELALVASGFLLRVLGGAAATHVKPSGWFLLVCSLGALGVVIAKRSSELAGLGAAAIRHRPALRWYRPAILRLSQYAAAALMVVTYLMWASGEQAGARDWHLISALPQAAALIRFGMLTSRRTVTPVEDLLIRDGPMVTCELAWLALFAARL